MYFITSLRGLSMNFNKIYGNTIKLIHVSGIGNVFQAVSNERASKKYMHRLKFPNVKHSY